MEIRFPEIALGNGYFANILFIFVHVLPFQKHHENRTWEDAEDDFFVVLDKVDKYDAISVPTGSLCLQNHCLRGSDRRSEIIEPAMLLR